MGANVWGGSVSSGPSVTGFVVELLGSSVTGVVVVLFGPLVVFKKLVVLGLVVLEVMGRVVE